MIVQCLHLFILTIWYLFQVNDVRKYLFTKKGRGVEGLPPTRDALEQHVKRAVYPGGYVRGQATALRKRKAAAKSWSIISVVL